MSQAGPGELYFLELFSPTQGGGLRANNVSLNTNLDGKRETLRALLRGYMGQTIGSTIRQIEAKDHVDFQYTANGIDLEACFVNGETLNYRITRYSDGAAAEGNCHLKAGPKITSSDGAITEIDFSLDGDASLFQ